MGRTAEAATQFERSLEIEPNAKGYSNLGSLYFFDGRYADAVTPFEKAAEITPSDSRFWMNLADAYRWTPALSGKAAGTYRHAIGLIEQEIGESAGRAASLEAAMARRSGERQQAIAEIGRRCIDPADGFVRYRAALVYEQAGWRDRALREASAALAAGRLHEICMRRPSGVAARSKPGAILARKNSSGKQMATQIDPQ
jgi:Flp pilus assembly protein TadD